jgi:hypothetical protein
MISCHAVSRKVHDSFRRWDKLPNIMFSSIYVGQGQNIKLSQLPTIILAYTMKPTVILIYVMFPL